MDQTQFYICTNQIKFAHSFLRHATLDDPGEWQLLQGSKLGTECTAPPPSLDIVLFRSGASVQVRSYQDLWTRACFEHRLGFDI